MLDPQDALGTEADIVAIYRRAELYLIRVIRDAIIRAGESPHWAEAQLLAIRQERHRIEGMAQALEDRQADLWHKSMDAAYMRGVVAAEAELAQTPAHLTGAGVGATAGTMTAINDAAAVALAANGMSSMHRVHANLLRATDDIWRQITREAAGYTTSGNMTMFEAAQRAYTKMAGQGLGFFTDAAGRRWGLDTYAEMSVRTATTRALIQGHTDTFIERGVDLVVVSSHPRPAPMCAPYERKVLSLTGRFSPGVHTVDDNIVTVKATLDEAIGNGFMHQNCRHRISMFVPGFTDLTPPDPDPGNEGYKATQKQRYYERQIRSAKRQQAAAIDPAAKARADDRVRAYQAKLRDHVDQWDLPRRRHREQVRRPAKGAVAADYDA